LRDETVIRSIERAMLRIARSMGRRDLGRQVERSLGSRVDTSLLQVVAAIDELGGGGEAPTIKDIARQLDVHHSRASRLVKDAIRAGLVMRLASQEDARKSPLALGEKGLEIAASIHAARARFFAAGLQGLSRSDRRNLAQLLEQFAENDAEANRRPGRGTGKTGEASSSENRTRKTRRQRKSG